MELNLRPKYWLGLALAGIVLMCSGSAVRADNPDPQNPTFTPSGGGPSAPVIASEEAWADITALVTTLFPGSDYDTVAYYALQWYNVLPPDYAPPPPPPEGPPPPEEDPPAGGGEETPPPTVATFEEWDAGCFYILVNYMPDATDEDLIYFMLLWFNLLPPDQF